MTYTENVYGKKQYVYMTKIGKNIENGKEII